MLYIHLFLLVALTLLCVILAQLVHTITAHMDAVTSLAIDPNGLYLISGSKLYQHDDIIGY